MIRSSVLREHKISYDEALISANDRKLFIDISEVAKLANINQIIHLYRFHASNTSKTKRKSIEEQQIILRRYLLGKINVRLSEAEEDLFNNAFMKGRVKIKSLSTLNQLVDLAEKLIKANELSGYYPKDIFKKHCKKYLIKRLKNAVFYGRLNSYSVAQSSPLLKNEKLPFLVKISKFL